MDKYDKDIIRDAEMLMEEANRADGISNWQEFIYVMDLVVRIAEGLDQEVRGLHGQADEYEDLYDYYKEENEQLRGQIEDLRQEIAQWD